MLGYEQKRIRAVRRLSVLDELTHKKYEDYAFLMRDRFKVPYGLVNMVDYETHRVIAAAGSPEGESPIEISFCNMIIKSDESLIVEDAKNDKRFADNHYVKHDNIQFYAGEPIHSPDGYTVGSICVVDNKPRKVTEEEVFFLKKMAQLVEAELESIQMANSDPMTLLLNKRGFVSLAEHTIQTAYRRKEAVTVIFFDLNKFKEINDIHGHVMGNDAIICFATALQKSFRLTDIVSRFGGDEFIVLAPDLSSSQIQIVTERLNELVEQECKSMPFNVSYSYGSVTSQKMNLTEFMIEADEEMYKMKKSARSG